MIVDALPWFLFAFALLLLVIELMVSHRVYAKAETMIAELLQQQRIDQADINDARTAYHRVVGERDRARDTVRNLLDAKRAGYRWPRPAPLPMPPDVDDTLVSDFTAIISQNVWPKLPEPPT